MIKLCENKSLLELQVIFIYKISNEYLSINSSWRTRSWFELMYWLVTPIGKNTNYGIRFQCVNFNTDRFKKKNNGIINPAQDEKDAYNVVRSKNEILSENDFILTLFRISYREGNMSERVS